MLSELEGAIMLEIHLRGRSTAFQVRSAFQTSLTPDWSGSAGAVYPAIKRLEAAGLIASKALEDRRGTRSLSATEQGIAALHDWATAPDLACKLNADPFRTRVDYLKSLPPRQRKQVLADILAAMEQSLSDMQALLQTDHDMKATSNALAGEALRLRMEWIKDATSED
ncbi:PadR family transcriptional regulator [Henriciella sp. AS95]|uniref:PadR family transcriptional regulator n=1 Tax=Henriciella sp. AS95 TaxID=3135782 RepID=UPI00317DDC26